MNQIVIENGYIISMNPDRQVFEGGDILIEGDCIAALGRIPSGLVREDAERVNARGKLVMPGFINSHVHLSQQLARGLGDDVDLLTWLHQRIWPYESSMEREDVS